MTGDLGSWEASLVSVADLGSHELEGILRGIFASTDHRTSYAGKVAVLIQQEPSTRNRLSFESECIRLGAGCVAFTDLTQTSLAKGETFSDMAKVVGVNADIIGIRTSLIGLPRLFQLFSGVPVINLGDGSNEHPTQALATGAHLMSWFGRIKGLRILLWGDLRESRCAHSVAMLLLAMGAEVILAEPFDHDESQRILDYSLAGEWAPPMVDIAAIPDRSIDVLYVARWHTERRHGEQPPMKGTLTQSDLDKIDDGGLVLHPLPRGPEFPPILEKNPKVRIWEHVRFGRLARRFAIRRALAASMDGTLPSDLGRTVVACEGSDCASSYLPDQVIVRKRGVCEFCRRGIPRPA